MPRRTIILFKTDNLRPGEIAVELQDVTDFGAAPAINRLVVIPDAAQVAVRPGQQAQPKILSHIGVLILVHHDVGDAAVIFGQHIGMRPEDGQHMQQQITEIDRVQRQQPGLVGLVELAQAAIGKIAGLGNANLVGGQATILPALDHTAQKPDRPALRVNVVRHHQLLENAVLVIHVENGEIAAQPHEIGMPPQHARRKSMECAEPHLFRHRADHAGDPHLHLARRLVGEGHRKDVPGLGLAGRNQFGKARGEYPGLAGSGAGEHQQRAGQGLHRLALRVVQAVKPGVGCRRGCLHGRQSRKSPGGGQRRKPALRHLTGRCRLSATAMPPHICRFV